MYVCPECANEWPCAPESDELDAGVSIVDSNGNVLSDGDTVAVIKDLKVGPQYRLQDIRYCFDAA